MKLIPIDKVVVPEDRHRKTFSIGRLDLLADSIVRTGLLQAILVREDGKTLIAGECRVRAIRQLYEQGDSFSYGGEPVPIGFIPTLSLGEMNDVALRTVELHENIRRSQLTWQEKARAIAQLHELSVAKAEAEGRPHTYKDTANDALPYVNTSSSSAVKEDVFLNDWLDDPDVEKAKSKDDAIRVITQKLDVLHRQALAREFSRESLEFDIIKGDMREILPQLDAGLFDLIIADPPYGIDADKFSHQYSKEKQTYSDGTGLSNELYECVAAEGFRITKHEAHAYVFCDLWRYRAVQALFESAGWYVWNTPLIWYKGALRGVQPRPKHGPKRTYEAILYAIKGDREIQSSDPDVLLHDRESKVLRGAQKPVSLYMDLITRSCLPGDKILDPCCGSGTIFEAARKPNTIGTGIEISDEAIGLIIKRFEEPTDTSTSDTDAVASPLDDI